MQVKSSKYNTLLQLSDTPFAKGGEAELYQVLSKNAYPSHLAKIYYPHKRTAQQEYKIQYLLRHAPQTVTDQDIPWVKDILYSPEGDFLGFILPRVYGQNLEALCLPKLPKHLDKNASWQPFDRAEPTAIRYRLQVCLNLTSLVAKIHEMGCYTIIDLKPDNVLVRSDATVSIIDGDSMEITEDNIELFAAKVITHEYTPPEYYRGINPQTTIVENSWDCFSLAVIIYRVLFGIHPFAATAQAPFDRLNTLSQKIEQGLFVHSPAKPIKFRHIPLPHQYFEQLPSLLQELFIDCFNDGYTEPHARPTASQWEQALYLALRQIQHLTIEEETYSKIFTPNKNQLEKTPKKKKADKKTASGFVLKIQNYIPSRAFVFLSMVNYLVFGILTFDFFLPDSFFINFINQPYSDEEVTNFVLVLFFVPISIQLLVSFLASIFATNEYDGESAKFLFVYLLLAMIFALIFPAIDYVFGDNFELMTTITTVVIVTGVLYYPYMTWKLFNMVIRNDEQLDEYTIELEKKQEKKDKQRAERYNRKWNK